MDPILIHEDRMQRLVEATTDRTSHVYRQLRNDMLDGLLCDDQSQHAYVKGDGSLGTRTALDWFEACIDDEAAHELLSIIARLANRRNDPRDLVQMQLQAMAILSKCAAEYADLYADAIVCKEND